MPSLPAGLALSWLWGRWGSTSCPSISPVWNLFYTEKYLELKRECHLGEINWYRKVERPAPYIWHIGPIVSSLMEKNPPDLDNRHKENRFVWSSNTVQCSGLILLCSSLPQWPRMGELLVSTPRHVLFAKPHLANVACAEAVTGRVKPGAYFCKTIAILCPCSRVCCRAAASGCWYASVRPSVQVLTRAVCPFLPQALMPSWKERLNHAESSSDTVYSPAC